MWMLNKLYRLVTDPIYLSLYKSRFLYDTLIPRAMESSSDVVEAKVGLPFFGWAGAYTTNIQVISDPKLAAKAIRAGDRISNSRPFYQKFADMIGLQDVLVRVTGPEGDAAREKHKAFTNPANVERKLAGDETRIQERLAFLDSVPEQTTAQVKTAFAALAKGEDSVHINQAITQACMRIVSKLLLGTHCLPDNIDELTVEMDRVLKIGDEKTDEYQAAAKQVKAMSKQFVRDNLDDIKQNDSVLRSKIESMLGKCVAESTDEEILQQLDSFACLGLLAGATNITEVLTTAVVEVYKQPAVLQKLRKELKEVGELQIKPPRYTMKEAPFLYAVYREALRHRSIVTALYRLFEQPCYEDGLEIPARTLVVAPVQAMSNDPDMYENPSEFIPERFMGEDAAPFPPLVFSSGPRTCIASNYYAPVMFAQGMKAIVEQYDIALQDEYELAPWFDGYTHYQTTADTSDTLTYDSKERSAPIEARVTPRAESLAPGL